MKTKMTILIVGFAVLSASLLYAAPGIDRDVDGGRDSLRTRSRLNDDSDRVPGGGGDPRANRLRKRTRVDSEPDDRDAGVRSRLRNGACLEDRVPGPVRDRLRDCLANPDGVAGDVGGGDRKRLRDGSCPDGPEGVPGGDRRGIRLRDGSGGGSGNGPGPGDGSGDGPGDGICPYDSEDDSEG